MKLTVTKHGAIFALMLIVALFAYLYITSPMLEFIKVLGCALSALLFVIAMQARLCKHIDTKQLGADWALLFVGACGLSFFVFFWDLSVGSVSNKAWWALIIGVLCHVIGLACWYGQNLINNRRKAAKCGFLCPKEYEMSVKEIQRSLCVTADGIWANQSQAALDSSKLKLDYSLDKMSYAFGGFTKSQVAGFNEIMAAINANQSAKNPLFAAYILATVWHETAKTMQSVAEYGKGKTRKYGQWFTNSNGQKYGIRNSKGAAYLQSEYPHLYYGRGYCQLTWLDNYIELGKMINVDLANNPGLALEPKNAANILIAGMLTGAFTGMSLSRCIKTGVTQEFVNARKIINGTDRDKLVADYAVKFLDCIILSEPPTRVS